MQLNDKLPRAPALHLEAGADAAQIAVAIVSTWQQIELELAPILRKRGVAALYNRAVFLTSAEHPWLAPLHETAGEAIDLAALKAVLIARDGSSAAQGAGAMLRTFREVLNSLVGHALCERLLGAAWQGALVAIATQGNRP